ncbi:hypothetical protein NMY22_g11367 [Coprinellus aureogranulatus]|nr:hypothetical protein NMY22_g11367 [Coprinellus aureogranulatus]
MGVAAGLVYAVPQGMLTGPKSPDGAAMVAEDALSQRANPRTHSERRSRSGASNGRHSNAQSDDSEDEALRDHAERVVHAMSTSHGRAVQKAAPGVKVAPPKVKGSSKSSAPPKKPVQRLNVRLDRIVNLAAGRRTPSPAGFTCARLLEFPEDTKMEEVIDWIVSVVDTECTRAYGERIYSSSELFVMWVTSKTQVEEDHLKKATLGDFWRTVSANLNFVKAADKKINRLDFYVNVKVQTNRDEDDDSDDAPAPSSDKYKTRAKQTRVEDHTAEARSDGVSRKKRTHAGVAISGSAAYQTQVADTTGIAYEVEKMYFACMDKQEPNRVTLTTSSRRKDVIIEKDFLALGKTKHVYKMLMDNTSYAAKCFYDVGKGSFNVSLKDNEKHLQDELLRQYIAKSGASRFMEIAKANNVSVYNLCVQDAFVIRVVKGTEKGRCYIADILYDDADLAMCKFSGTDEAGHNTDDLVGRTCDAWAHHSFYDSQETLVFVDIQGIDTALLPVTSRRNVRSEGMKLVLFDIMIHSNDKRYGLGDKGEAGLQAFADQHVCNSICKSLGFPPTRTNVEKTPHSTSASPVATDISEEAAGDQGKAREELTLDLEEDGSDAPPA